MGEKFELSYLDLCRLSQAFNRDANLAEPGDYRINEWLKQEIACRTIKVERAIGFVRVFRRLCLWSRNPVSRKPFGGEGADELLSLHGASGLPARQKRGSDGCRA